MKTNRYLIPIFFALIGFGFQTVDAQQNIAQQAYAIFQQNCLNCHGPHGAFTEEIVIESSETLINSGAVVPGVPLQSELYTRLDHPDPGETDAVRWATFGRRDSNHR